MSNLKQDVYKAEHDRMAGAPATGRREMLFELPRDAFRRVSHAFSKHVGGPVAAVWSAYYSRVSRKLLIAYRRSSTRAAGLVLNTLDGIVEMAFRRS
jgi:hypothetical protein